MVLSILGAIAWLLRATKKWMQANVSGPIAQNRAEQAATHHLVAYHLGPNGDTKPLHHRVADVEQAVGVNAPPAGRWKTETRGEQE